MTDGQTEANQEFGEYESDQRGRAGYHKEGAGDFERIRDRSRDRLKLLAKHKEPHIAWHTCVGPRVMYGTQEMLWPVSPRAMVATATPRLSSLATPKKDFQEGTITDNRPTYYYSCGRSSVIWTVADGAKGGSSTERVSFLAQPKQFHPNYQDHKQEFFYSCGRETPIWRVSEGAKAASAGARTDSLAEHKRYHPEFQDERPVQSIVSDAAQSAKTSDYISKLAEPKNRADGPFRHPQWPVSDKAKGAVASGRCMELARSKPLAEGFLHAKDVEWQVSKAAKRAQASGRLAELARPISRASMDHVQFNPNAFAVKESALKGVIPRRIEELAIPVQR